MNDQQLPGDEGSPQVADVDLPSDEENAEPLAEDSATPFDPDSVDRSGARIFISYAHEDEDLKEELDKHLKVLKRSSKVEVWSDRQLAAGQEWDDSIMSELRRANIILLLISVDFNASDFIWDKELAVAMERHHEGTSRVVPIILRKCNWEGLPYAALQALPRHARPVTEYPDRDVAYTEIAEAVEQLVDQINDQLSVRV